MVGEALVLKAEHRHAAKGQRRQRRQMQTKPQASPREQEQQGGQHSHQPGRRKRRRQQVGGNVATTGVERAIAVTNKRQPAAEEGLSHGDGHKEPVSRIRGDDARQGQALGLQHRPPATSAQQQNHFDRRGAQQEMRLQRDSHPGLKPQQHGKPDGNRSPAVSQHSQEQIRDVHQHEQVLPLPHVAAPIDQQEQSHPAAQHDRLFSRPQPARSSPHQKEHLRRRSEQQ